LPEANRIASTRCLRLSALYAQGSESSFSDFGSLQLFFKKECFYLLRRRSPSGLSGADELSAGLLDSLNIKFPENISGAIKFIFKIGSENKVTKIENVNIIQISQDNADVKEILKQVMTKQVEENIPLLDSAARKDVEETSKGVDLNSNDQELLQYYKGKLPSYLHELLNLCLILRNMRFKRLDIRGFKLRIMKEYPIYGRNMTNLVNEKYFEYKFKELYAEMEKSEDFKISDFHNEIDYQNEIRGHPL